MKVLKGSLIENAAILRLSSCLWTTEKEKRNRILKLGEETVSFCGFINSEERRGEGKVHLFLFVNIVVNLTCVLCTHSFGISS